MILLLSETTRGHHKEYFKVLSRKHGAYRMTAQKAFKESKCLLVPSMCEAQDLIPSTMKKKVVR